MSYHALVRRSLVVAPGAAVRRLDLESFARSARLHPDVVRRLVTLGLLDPKTDRDGRLSFDPAQLVIVARIHRLRAGFGINYAALGLVLDLMDRVAELEERLRQLRP